MEDTPYSLKCAIRALNKPFRIACSQVILLNHKIEAAKARYDRARASGRLSFRYSNRLKLTSLEGVRNLIYEYARQKCEEIESLQEKLRNMTNGDFEYSDSEASGDDDDEEESSTAEHSGSEASGTPEYSDAEVSETSHSEYSDTEGSETSECTDSEASEMSEYSASEASENEDNGIEWETNPDGSNPTESNS